MVKINSILLQLKKSVHSVSPKCIPSARIARR